MGKQFDLWFERLARGAADFLAAQMAGIFALVAIATRGSPPPAEPILVHYYLHTFVPLSLMFPAVHSLFGLYTRLRGYTLGYKLRAAALSASVAALILTFASSFLRAHFPSWAALFFGVAAVAVTVGVRWMKDWLFHREAVEERGALVAASNEGAVLVVGGAGYIGSVVTANLLSRGYRVKLLDNLLYGSRPIEPLLSHSNLEFIQGDSRNIQDVVRAITDVKHVIHLAAIVGDPACAENDSNALQINYAATRMILEIAKGHGIERFLFASSCSVYGASDDLMDEKSQTVPISLYAETKLNSERVLLDATSRSFHPTILRFATVFGLAMRPRFDLVVNLLTAKAIQDGIITIYNGDQWRPFIHVSDVAAGVVDALGAPLEAVSGEIFNLGDDRLNFTLAQIAEKIRHQIPRTQVEYVENTDRRNYRVSFRKIHDCIGFRAKRSIESGISEIKKAFERGEIVDYRHSDYSNVSYLKERGHLHAKSELDVQIMAAFAGIHWEPAANVARPGRPALTLVPGPIQRELDSMDSTQPSVS